MGWGGLPARLRCNPSTAFHEVPVYIDPAAGSLILQVLIAGILAVSTMLKSVRASIKRFFQGLFGRRRGS
jgi:hypothetical protein